MKRRSDGFFDQTGCGECRISLKGSALEIIGNGYSDAAWQHYLSLGARFRSQPLAPEGATLTGKRGLTAQRGQAEGAAVAMNAEMRSQ
jgi:hypothetical protein